MEISTESDSEITESSTGDRDVNWELGVAEWGQKCRETSDHVGNEYCRARYVTCDGSGGHEDTDSEHSADAERDEVEPSELALHVGAWTESDLGNLLVGSPRGEHPGLEPVWCLWEAVKVLWHALFFALSLYDRRKVRSFV